MKIKIKTLKKIRRFSFIFMGVFFLFSIFYIYFKSSFFTINNYEIVGVEEKYTGAIQEKLHTLDKQKLYYFLPANRVISYHKTDIKNYINELLPNTSKVSISIASLHTLKISVNSYDPLFKLAEGKAITSDGFVYKELKDTSNLPELSFASTSIVTAEILSKISDIIPKISAAIFDVKSINIDENNDVYIYGGENNKSSVIFTEDSDIKKIWSNIVSAIDTDPLKSKLNDSKETLEYLDARFGNKVFYKFTNDGKTDIIPSTNSHATTTEATTTPTH